MNTNDQQIYETICRKGGFVDLSRRAKIDVTGPDRVSFLHSMISHDVQALQVGGGRYATFLTATGKIIADFFLYKLADRILIDIAEELADPLQEALERFVIMDDVHFTRWQGPAAHLALHGPASGGILQQLTAQQLPSNQLEIREIKQPGPGWVLCKPGFLAEGYEIISPSLATERLKAEMAALGFPEIPPALTEVLRIEAMIPLFGIDITSENNPLEARLDHAYSLTKGCYVGQEVVAKATHVGGVNRLLVGLRLPPEAPLPAPGTVLAKDQKRVGMITSACYSPRLKAPIALGYLRRKLAHEGDEIQIELPGDPISARVCLDFFLRGPA